MKQRLTNHFKLTFYLCLFTAVAVGIFLRDAPASGGVLPWIYQISIAGYFGTLLLVSSLVLLPFSLYGKTRWLLPLLAWVWSRVWHLDATQTTVLLAFSALPTASTCYVLATRMGYNGGYVGALVTLSTLSGMLSLPFALGVLG